MKGTILVCVKELVEKKFGSAAWDQALAAAGKPRQIFLAPADVPDATVLEILKALSGTTKLTQDQLLEAFGDYWVNEYATRVYPSAFSKRETAMDFLLGLDGLHTMMTKMLPNARPPHFACERKGDRTVELSYQSPRKLGAMVPGLVRGVARKYGTRCTVRALGGDRFEITF